MDLAPPPADAAPISSAPMPSPAGGEPPDRLVGGVAGLLAERLHVDALWLRVGFVLLALVGGVGVLLYGALWLAFVVGDGPDRRWARLAGGVIVVVGLPLALTGGFRLMDGPVAVFALLAGLAVALWQPRRPIAARASYAAPSAAASSDDDPVRAAPRVRRSRRSVRPPSILGRLALGTAVLVAAAGALIDEANGGRLHPEQWLGAAAIVCGAGLVVGAVRGRAEWLVVPAALFVGAGFVAGEAARVGVDPGALVGSRDVGVDAATPGGSTIRADALLGDISVRVDSAPSSPVTIDVRVAIGGVYVSLVDDVTVEVRADTPHGVVRLDGQPQPDRTTVGPDGPADIVLIARVGRGDVLVRRHDATPPAVDVPPIGTGRPLAEGVLLMAGGQVVLANGEAVLGSDDRVMVGPWHNDSDGVTFMETSVGAFQLLPEGLLINPWGEVVDLQAARDALVDHPTATGPAPAAPTGPTGPTVPGG